jgi:allophanate hydrolase
LQGTFAFAIPRRDQLEFHGDALSAQAFDAAVDRIAVLGGVASEIDFAPWRAVAAMLYEGPHVAERHAGIRAFFDAHPDALDPTVRDIVAGARGYCATDVFEAQALLDERRDALAPLWDECDVLVVPTAPTIYTIAEVGAAPVERNRRLGVYTNFVNLLDLAAIAVPAAFRDDGLPFGITLIGPAGSDLMLADLAQRFHADTGLPLGALGTPMPAAEPLLPRGDTTHLTVVGAHLAGLPLNRELIERGARLVRPTRTAASYRLYALPGTVPPKPGLVRSAKGDGAAIDVEVWEIPTPAFGAFVATIPSPLSIGTIALEDGSGVQGFLCEAAAVEGADDITHYGGWRAYIAARAGAPAAFAPEPSRNPAVS